MMKNLNIITEKDKEIENLKKEVYNLNNRIRNTKANK
jgi:hypothetical protein